MGFISTWRARTGNLFAVLLVIAMLTPTLDMLACSSELPLEDAAQVVQVVKAMDAGAKQAPQPIHDKSEGGCIHGHCHHTIGSMKVAEQVQFALALRSSERSLAEFQQPPSAPVNDLLRPPCA